MNHVSKTISSIIIMMSFLFSFQTTFGSNYFSEGGGNKSGAKGGESNSDKRNTENIFFHVDYDQVAEGMTMRIAMDNVKPKQKVGIMIIDRMGRVFYSDEVRAGKSGVVSADIFSKLQLPKGNYFILGLPGRKAISRPLRIE